MTPYFSVIVPVYKVEAYLAPCVDSILAQTCADFELLLVDDGSPDGCGALCDGYGAKDPRVRVIHQENQGLAKARKAGLLRAAAEYVCFVDSDDWVLPRWLETVRELIEQNGRPDIVLFDHTRDAGPAEYPILAEEGFYDKARLEREIYPYMLCDLRRRPLGAQFIPAYAWERVTRRQLLLDHYIPDDVPVTLFEDTAMSYECMAYASSMYICRQALYVYRLREQSLLTGYRPQYLDEVNVVFDYLSARLGRSDPVYAVQINALFAMRLVKFIALELAGRGMSVPAAARSLAAALKRTGYARKLTYRGLDPAWKAFLLAVKLRLCRTAAMLVKMRM